MQTILSNLWHRVIVEGKTILKRINHFQTYSEKQKTSLAKIKKAYAASENAAAEAKRIGQMQYLVSCAKTPKVTKGRYEVRTVPCGYTPNISSEEVRLLHAVAKSTHELFHLHLAKKYSSTLVEHTCALTVCTWSEHEPLN